MNWESFKFAAIGAVQTLTQGWSYKALIAAMLAMILHKHAILFYSFAFLVFVDCFTKWVAISYLHLKDSGIESLKNEINDMFNYYKLLLKKVNNSLVFSIVIFSKSLCEISG